MAEEKEVQEAAPGKKSTSLKLVLIILVALVLVGGGAVAWLMLAGGDGEGVPDEVAQMEAAAEKEAVGLSFPMDTFVVNLNDIGGKRYLKTNIELEYVTPEMGEELKQRLPQLRDTILLLLSSKGLDDIQGVEGKIALRRELIQRINQNLKSGKIRNLYFTQFVIQ